MCAQPTNALAEGHVHRTSRRRGRFGVLGLVGVIVLIYIGIAMVNPWALHIGGRSTPFLYWTGTGKLTAKSGTYPIYISLSPSPHFSRLHLDGLRPTGGVQGRGLLCASPGSIIPIQLSGTIYGGWRTTDGSLMEIRLLETNSASQRLFSPSHRGYFDLFGYWRGPQLPMNDRGGWSSAFRSGLRIEHSSVTFAWGSKSDFDAACANATDHIASSGGKASSTPK